VTGQSHGVPPPIDMTIAHPARMHDYWLGGGHNVAADRQLAEKIREVLPGVEDSARLSQSFIRRAALYLVESGVRQFLDIASSLPSVGALHTIVQRVEPACRVVYVDIDPVAIAHGELKLKNTERAATIRADVRDVAGIFRSEPVRRLFDPTQPVALMAPMLHFLPDSLDPATVLAGYRDRLASGSYVVVANVAADATAPGLPDAVEVYKSARYHVHPRSAAEILRICAGFDMVEPGLVGSPHWRPEDPGDATGDPDIDNLIYAGVGRKP
jgi:hypothetical protein